MHLPEASASRGLPARERILHTAYRLFYANGIRATGVDRVIAESGVTKVTFYRHFPSKADLVRAFLELRHRLWMEWFRAALARNGGSIEALVPTLSEWFASEDFRGCAFINAVGEVGGDVPDVLEITRRHKSGMTEVIAGLLPPDRRAREEVARAAAVAVDGAIVGAQWGRDPQEALAALRLLLRAVDARGGDTARLR